jgi:poly(hydroxyalkanoate) granule-associated protein
MTAKKKSTTRKASTKKATRKTSSGDGSTARKAREELRESAHKIWLAGLGAMAAAEEEGQRFFKHLVERGEDFEAKGRERFGDAKGRAEKRFEEVTGKIGSSVEDQVNRTLDRLGVPSRQEVRNLSKKIEALTAKIDELSAKSK